MIAPSNFKEMSDEELLNKLVEIYADTEVAAYLLDVLRGRIKPARPLR